MLSKNKIKHIKQLHKKKYRQEQGLFLVEGEKVCVELLQSDWNIQTLCVTESFYQTHQKTIKNNTKAFELFVITAKELTALGTLNTNQTALAIVQQQPFDHMSDLHLYLQQQLQHQWVFALDTVNDPGNLGSLIRIADWYGIKHLICTPTTVELYNPKVIAASKGSFLRVQVHSMEFVPFFTYLKQQDSLSVLAADLKGVNIHDLTKENLPKQHKSIVLLGSEAHGIDKEYNPWITQRVTIPKFGQAESLNVGIAAAIICDNLQRLHSFH